MKVYALLASLAAASALSGAAALAMSSDMNAEMHGRFGGPVYNGAPALGVTASLVAAGNDAGGRFSTAKALTSMVGATLVNKEVAKLDKQYGEAAVKGFLKTFDFAVNDSLKIATAAGVKLPAADMSGTPLAATLVKAGTAADGTFQIEYLLDKAVSHKIHVQVMNDIDAQRGLGKKADFDYHRISNQAFYDLAQALGATGVKLAAVH
jgi:hypothetical protein